MLQCYKTVQSRTATTRECNDCQQLAEQIAQTDREIDQRVYLLYGLTEEEISIVESR